MRGDDARTEALRDAINVPVTARDEKAAFHLKLAIEGSPLDIARQVYVDRDKLLPIEVPPALVFSKPDVFEAWRKGGPIPDELKPEFAAWLVNHTARRHAQSENERRLRASMTAQRALAQSEQECDRRQASAFGRWHLEHWRIADIPAWAPAGEEQPFEMQLRAALGRLPR